MLAQNRSLVDRLRALVGAWRLRAEPFADHHCDAVAAVYNRLASEVEAELRAWDSEALPIQDAAAESGYSAEHLRRLARGGKLLSERGEGAKVICACDARPFPPRMSERRGTLPASSQPTIRTRTPETSPNG